MDQTVGRVARLPFPNRMVVLGVVLLAGTLGLLRAIPVGSATGLGLLTAVEVAFLITLAFSFPVVLKDSIRVLLPIILLTGMGFVSLLHGNSSQFGIQNLTVLMGFLLLVTTTSIGVWQDERFNSNLSRALTIMAILGAALYLPTLARQGLGAKGEIAGRGFGIFAILGISHALAMGRIKFRFAFNGLATGLLVLVGASLHRIAFAAGLMLLFMSRLSKANLSSAIKATAAVFLALLVFALAALQFSPLQERFLLGDVSLRVGGVGINTEGRIRIWSLTLESAKQSIWVGNGAGSAEDFVVSINPRLGHPHNDYLRVLHDYGLTGLCLWVWGLTRIGRRLLLRARRRGVLTASEMSALLSLVGFIILMVTDNPITYSFFMFPLAVILGRGLANYEYDEPLVRVRAQRSPR